MTFIEAAGKMRDSSEQKIYTFTIRPHVWSNGKPVTAYHFESAWKQALSLSEACPRVDLFYMIKNIKAAKEGTLRIQIQKTSQDRLVGVKNTLDALVTLRMNMPQMNANILHNVFEYLSDIFLN